MHRSFERRVLGCKVSRKYSSCREGRRARRCRAFESCCDFFLSSRGGARYHHRRTCPSDASNSALKINPESEAGFSEGILQQDILVYPIYGIVENDHSENLVNSVALDASSDMPRPPRQDIAGGLGA